MKEHYGKSGTISLSIDTEGAIKTDHIGCPQYITELDSNIVRYVTKVYIKLSAIFFAPYLCQHLCTSTQADMFYKRN